ncbi:substrate-binding periplasmic protein [Lacibacterium aquatile]|uniref:Substrate-binding periplasmic protein n=1 Tax=Lacibacterium aquatile TaxID=1168082 RepID=A0ABW5DTI2_9PROT
MSRFSVAVLLAAAAVSGTALAKEKVRLLADSEYPPYVAGSGAATKGMYVDILKAAADRMTDYEVEIDGVPWKRGLKDIEDGTALGIVPPYKRPDSRPWMQPYSEVLFEEQIVVYCHSDAAAKVAGAAFPAGYKGLSFGNNAGFQASPDLLAMSQKGEVKIEEAQTTEANLRKLVAGRIDCYSNDKVGIDSVLASIPAGQRSKQPVETAVVQKEAAFVGYSSGFQAPYKADFIAKLDAALKAIKADGTLDAIVKRYTGM